MTRKPHAPAPITASADHQASVMSTSTVEVTVLTQLDCGFCEIAQAVLARVAQDHPLAVRWIELDSEHGRDLAMRHGVLFAPGVLLDGEMFSYGRLSERRLRRHLARRAASADQLRGDQGADLR